MDNFKSYSAEGYDLNSIIHSAVSYKARTVALGRLVAFQGDMDKPMKLEAKHPLAKLLARPNPYQSWMEFQQQRMTYLNLSGNSYTWLDRPKIGAQPTALWNLRPDRVYVVPNDRRLMGYLYVPDDRAREDGVPMLPEDVIHVKFPNPRDRFEGLGYGLSPLAPLAMSGDVDNAITRYLKVFFERGSMPNGVLKTNLSLDTDGVADARARWQQIYGGVDNWTDIAVLDKDLSYQRVGLTFEEMGFDALDGRNETRMLGPFGVPAILIGVRVGLLRSTYNNAVEARKACWQDTLNPEQMLFHSDDEFYLGLPDEEIFVQYDNSAVPAMQEDRAGLITSWAQLVDRGVPVNQAFQIMGIKVENVVGGDVAYRASSMVPVGSLVQENETNEGAPSADDEAQQMGRVVPPQLRLAHAAARLTAPVTEVKKKAV
ncbi:phage portal protein [Candidatus Parcubacteria bacterium]|nr:phage portal protein [Candidatus Parcubacteria bacterium]